MYSYKKEKKFPKRKLIVSLFCLMAVSVSYFTYEYYLQSKPSDTSVFKEEDVPVLALPNSTEEKAIKPFEVDAQIVLDFFDGKESDVESITEFEGIYRGNQGMDYTFQGEAFNVLASLSGTVSEVKEDPIFGVSVTIVNQDISITYQSLADVAVKKGDKVNQKDVIAKAGKNVYNKELGNHLHIAVTKNGAIIDPELIYDKTLREIK